jgi:nucleotide-binding universal stress UspA family protein
MIIVGTDFSPTALLALGEARMLAHRLNTGLDVVHVRSVYTESEWMPTEEERTWLRAARVGEFDIDVRRGSAWVELVRAAGERVAHLIAVGTHGHSGYQPIALGSTAQRLALLSPIPILLVGAREREPGGPGEAPSVSSSQRARRTATVRPGP